MIRTLHNRRWIRPCLLAALIAALAAGRAQAQLRLPQPAPHGGYWPGFVAFHDGDFREAASIFRDAARGRVVTTSQTPWIDSICYHAMLGECHYQMGNLGEALEQYSSALKVFLANRYWMLRIDFDSSPLAADEKVKAPPAWGVSARRTKIGRFPDNYSSLRGRLDNATVFRTGGIIEPAEYHPVNVAEIVRCTALALSRRREIMGPACEHDPLTGQLVTALALRPGPPNHWSQSWVELELGLAYASANMIPQAIQELTKSLLAADTYDHPLTSVSLLELGRLAFEQGKYDAAVTYLHEATISAAYFDRYTVMEEAFRLAALAHLLSGKPGIYSPLAPAAAATSRQSRLLQASLLTSLAEHRAAAGDLKGAAATIAQARDALGRRGMTQSGVGSRLHYQAARIALAGGDARAGGAALAAALAYQKSASLRLFQIGLCDGSFKRGEVTERIADLLFAQVLREPEPLDWAVDPLDTLAALIVPHPLPYEHWFEVALARKEQEKALHIADRIRRHRFFMTQPLGGRTLALRWILDGPEEALRPAALLQRQELLVRYPRFAELSRRAGEIKVQLHSLPVLPSDERESKQQAELLAELAKVSSSQESLLQMIALDRAAADFVFPPLRETIDIQKELPEGTLVFSYLATSRNVHAFALTRDRYGHFTVAQPAKVKDDVAQMLKLIGNSDRTQPVSADELKSNAWRPAAERLVKDLTNNTQQAEWSKYRELVVIPDSVLWYLPLEALPVPTESGTSPLLWELPLRYAPTLSLAVPDRRTNRPLARTVIVEGKPLPRDSETFVKSAAESVAAAAAGSAILRGEPPVGSAVFSAAFDRLVVLKDGDDAEKLPFGFSPLALEGGRAGTTLADWMQLPQGVDQVVLPCFHTPAEHALKRGGTGDEVFLAACGLLASGCRTVLLSRWRVGGQSTVDLVREFVQELPHDSASRAWQRSVELAANRLLDPATEGRLKASPASGALTADHPFFWSGYLLLDTGVAPVQDTFERPAAAPGAVGQ